MSYNKALLGDLCKIRQGRYIAPDVMKTVKSSEFDIPVYGGNGILGYTNKISHSRDVSLITCRGSKCGLMQWVKAPIWLSNNAMSCDTSHSVENRMLHYLFLNSTFDDVTTGSAQPQITIGHLSKKIFIVPEKMYWAKIVHILQSFDDRIDLLKRTNQTLEAIAQTIFKSWFVNFDPVHAKQQGLACAGIDAETAELFPNSFEDSELGQIPKGWEVLSFDKTIHVTGGGTPKTSNPDNWTGDIPWYSVVDAPQKGELFVIDTQKHITENAIKNSSTRLLPKGTTIISARGTVGKLAIVGVEMAMNQSCYALRGNYEDSYFTYFSTERLIETLKQSAHGSVFDTITTDTFKQIHVIYPDQKIVKAFEGVVGPLLEKIRQNVILAKTLSRIRDTLLPRLISGKLDVSAIETQFEETA